jgi:hypothetical protein
LLGLPLVPLAFYLPCGLLVLLALLLDALAAFSARRALLLLLGFLLDALAAFLTRGLLLLLLGLLLNALAAFLARRALLLLFLDFLLLAGPAFPSPLLFRLVLRLRILRQN